MRNVSSFGSSKFNGGVNLEDYLLNLADNELGEGTRNAVITKRGIIKKREGTTEVGSSAGATKVLSGIQYVEDDGTKHDLKVIATLLTKYDGSSAWDTVKTITTGLKMLFLHFFAMDGTDDDSGTATSATASTLVDSGKTWTVNAYKDKAVKITAGTGAGQVKYILENSATTLTIFGTWDTTPSSDSTYAIQDIVKSVIASNGTDQPFKIIPAAGDTIAATDLGATYPKFTIGAVHLKRIFYVDPANLKKLRWTDPFIADGVLNGADQNYWDVDDNIVALGVAGRNALIIYSKNQTGVLLGDEPDNFSFSWVDRIHGCVAQYTVASWKHYCFALADDGVYRCDGLENIKVSRRINPAIADIPRAYISGCESIVFDNKYHLSVPYAADSTYNDRIWAMDLIQSYEAKDELGESPGCWIPYHDLSFSTFWISLDTYNQERLYCGAAATYKVFRLYDGTFNDNGLPINYDVYTKAYSLGSLSRQKKLKHLFVAVKAQAGAYTLNVSVDVNQAGFVVVGSLNSGVISSLWDSAIFDTSEWEAEGAASVAVGKYMVGMRGRMVQYHFYNYALDNEMELYCWEQVYKLRSSK
jgi:hypothetical protein